MRQLIAFVAASVVAATAFAQDQTGAAAAGEPQEVDRIVAVVNNEVITLIELRARLATVQMQLRGQGTTLPPQDVFERQLLERLIVDRAQLQYAKENGLRVDDAQLDAAIGRIASQNGMSISSFRATLEKDGVPYARFREDIRQEILMRQLREREVENKIAITDGEVENFLATEGKEAGAKLEYELAHILVRVPEGASPEQLQKLRAKADRAVAQLKEGASFAEVAATYSDAPDALQGGVIGARTLDRLPALYAEAVEPLPAGQVTDVLRSPNGFHIVKVVAKRGSLHMAPVRQTHTRHILIRVNELVSERDAKHRLVSVAERLRNGGDFAELARLYSQDGSAAKGGDLGWIYPGDTVPEFERAMDALKPGEIGEPVLSQFGWHLIQVVERRTQDVSEERQKAMARQVLRERKSDDAYQDWLRQLRDRAYVEIRLEER